jgi:peptide/nickel transport system substrate-binding protein
MLGLLRYFTVQATPEYVPDTGGTYVEGVVDRPVFVNPLLATSGLDLDLSALIFSGLTKIDDQGEVVGDLAQSWEVSGDGRVWDFHLRQGIKWHDGVQFGADDVIFTIESIKAPSFPGDSNLANLWRNVETTKIDDFTIRLTLEESYAPFLNYTTVGIVPAHMLSRMPVENWRQMEFNLRPVGTGRFRMGSEGVAADEIVLDANTDYYGGRPALDKMRFKFYPTRESLLTALEAGEVDSVGLLQPDELDRVRELDNYSVYTSDLSNYSILFLNLRNPLFAEKTVRQALALALDRDRIIRQVLLGHGTVANSPILPTSWAHKFTVKQYSYDLVQASTLLDTAGWALNERTGMRERNGHRFSFVLVTNDSSDRVETAGLVRDQLKSVGIEVEVRIIKSTDLISNYLFPRKFEAAVFGWMGLSSDPDSYQMWHSTQADQGFNFPGWSNDQADQLLENGRQTASREERVKLYGQFQDIFAEEVPSILLYYPDYTLVVSNRLRGITASPLTIPSDRFRNVSSWYIKVRKILIPAQPES